MDGRIIHENLQNLNLTENYLINKLQIQGAENFKDVFYASLDGRGDIFFQMKSKAK